MDRRLTDRAEETTTIDAALEGVAPRLRRVREERGFTLAEVSERTGISKSTLSRLENGQRKPSLGPVTKVTDVIRGVAARQG